MLTELKLELDPFMQPASHERILHILTSVAQVFQVSLPDDEGLILYTHVLCDIPHRLLNKAAIEVCRTHGYKSLPVPNDFLRVIRDELAQWQWLEKLVDRGLALAA